MLKFFFSLIMSGSVNRGDTQPTELHMTMVGKVFFDGASDGDKLMRDEQGSGVNG